MILYQKYHQTYFQKFSAQSKRFWQKKKKKKKKKKKNG